MEKKAWQTISMLLLFKIQDYMERASRGEVSIPPEAVFDFADSCRDSVTTQLNKQRQYKIRMSGLGRPLCQQLLEKKGVEQEVQYNMLFRFLFGDLVEAIAVILKAHKSLEETMSRVCQVTGKRPMTGNNVSHANNKTRRRFLPNLHSHKFWVDEENRFVTLRVSSKGMRIIDKLGIKTVLDNIRDRGEKI